MISKNHKTKRVLSMILAAATALGMILFSPNASAGSSCTYSYAIENGEAKITDFSGSGDVTIPSEFKKYPVTTIGKHSFMAKGAVTSVVIPDSVKTIEDYAFLSCTSLKNVTIGDGVTTIGVEAFQGCGELKTLKIGSSVKTIDDASFSLCKSLERVIIPDNVEVIGSSVFASCTSLKIISVPVSVTNMGMYVFDSCLSLTDIYYGGTRSEWDEISKNANVPSGVRIHYGENPPVIDDPPEVDDPPVIDPPVIDPPADDDPPVVDPPADDDPPVIDPPVVDPPADDEPTVSFSDVKEGAFYADAVAWAVKKEITSGTSKTTFSPDNGCTRGQVVTFLHRAAGSPEPKSGKNPFSDVKTDDYFFKAVLWAVGKGVTAGTGKKTFSPGAVCTRGQIVTFLWRAAGSPEPKSGKNPFSDVGADDYFFKAVLWAVEEGITKGTSVSAFSPASPCTRAQIVTFLYRNMV